MGKDLGYKSVDTSGLEHAVDEACTTMDALCASLASAIAERDEARFKLEDAQMQLGERDAIRDAAVSECERLKGELSKADAVVTLVRNLNCCAGDDAEQTDDARCALEEYDHARATLAGNGETK